MSDGVRIAVLSDIHGNLPALEAVLADAAARGAELIVDLGDMLSGPLWPAETCDRLMALDLPRIRGNHERQLLTLSPERMGPSDLHTAERLRPDQRAWLATLPETREVVKDVLMVHGTPASDIQYLLETVGPEGVRAASADEVGARLGGTSPALLLCGHSHLPRALRHEDTLIVNPGSVGLPAYDDERPFPHKVETGSPDARYAIVQKDGERWSAELLATDYDWKGAARQAEANGRADWARALRTGRA